VVPKSMRKYYAKAQALMDETRAFFRVQRRKTRIQNRITRDRTQKRFRDHFKVGELVVTTRPSYTRRDGVKAIAKIVGSFRGPYKIVAVDTHNGVDVEIEGKVEHFNVSQISRTPDLEDRSHPAYSKDTLVYDWDEEGEVEADSQDEQSDGPEDEKSEVKDEPPIKKPKQAPKKAKVGGKLEKRFQILHDSVSKKNYAGELSNPDGILQARLFLAAKGNSYEPIWFNADRAEESKSSRSKPKGNWEPWTILVDSTWLRVGQEKPKIGQLHRKTLKSHLPSPQ
jgi:hypothetical protein